MKIVLELLEDVDGAVVGVAVSEMVDPMEWLDGESLPLFLKLKDSSSDELLVSIYFFWGMLKVLLLEVE